ncbi:salviol synthase-like [Andrographis paniculata]|uniref:salviol synthase-like n=1 Tax=Andrographis paniculata TaxID=175694 RepID=UPI0021E91BB8|nr:salviol synthase-like [Andrographis paniculata]
MDIDFTSSILLLSFIILLAKIIKVARQSSGVSNLPPGPRKLPVIGNLHQLVAGFQLPHQTLSDLARKYGPMMHLQLGEVITVVISSPDAAQEIMKTHDVAFANRPSLLAPEILFYKNTDIVFSPYSEYWRQLRKICTIELLSAKRVQSYKTLREGEVSKLCQWIASKEGSVIELSEKVSLNTCDIVMQASLGYNTTELAEFTLIVEETVELMAGMTLGDFFPSIKLIGLITGIKRRAERLHKHSDRILGNIIDECKATKDEPKLRENLVDVLVKLNDEGHELHLTIENIKSVLRDMFTAGIETSSTTVNWAMTEMLKHPKILKNAQNELRMVFKDKGHVDEADFDKLKYLKLVIKETLRLHPPAPLLAPRENSEQCKIHGYNIPAKTRVMVNVWSMGRDPKYWDDAESFVPERFLDNPVDFKGSNFEYLPFGAGRRICPGMSFGLANVELPLAMFLYHFDWLLPDGMKPEDLAMEETFGITTKRKDPLHVIPKLMNPCPVRDGLVV